MYQSLEAQIKRLFHTDEPITEIMTDIVKVTHNLELKTIDRWRYVIADQLAYGYRKVTESSPLYFWKKSKNDRHKDYFLRAPAWLDLANYDGFIREKALSKVLGNEVPNAFFCCILLRMLNDWVPEVRRKACFVLPSIIENSDPEFIVTGLFHTLENWRSWERITDVERTRLYNYLSNDQLIMAIKQRLITTPTGPMTYIFTQLGATRILDPHILEIAQYAIQPSLRARAYRCLYEKKVAWNLGIRWFHSGYLKFKGKHEESHAYRDIDVLLSYMDIFEFAIKDRSPIVRRIAAEIAIREMDNLGDNRELVIRLLMQDSDHSIAERGRYLTKNLTG